MNKHLFSTFILFITSCFCLIACSSGSPQEETSNPSPTLTLSPALTNTPVSTHMPAILSTLVEATPVNTMTSDEQKNFIREFLSNNVADCRLPCLWNITPGQAWSDAEKTIQGFGGVLVAGIPGYDPETTIYGTSIILKNVMPNTTISLEEKQRLVHAWHISSTGGVENPEEFRRLWKDYLAQKIVKMYGMPDRILLHGNPASNTLHYGLYSLWLFYDRLGFSILYDARIPMHFSNAPYFRVCSGNDPLLGIELNMQSSDNPLPLDRFDRTLEQVRLGTDIGKAIVIHSLQEATGLDDKEIYDTFTQSEEACFAIPSDIWRAKQ